MNGPTGNGAGAPAWVTEAATLPVGFAQVREDARLDRGVVGRLGAGARVIVVASGGCTAAALAAGPNVARLHIVDPNPAQLALARLKLRLLETADEAERLVILGHARLPVEERKDRLSAEWNALGLDEDILGSPEFVADVGPDHAGRYERLFHALRQKLEGHQAALTALLRLSDPATQTRRVAPTIELGRALDGAFDDVMALPNLVRLFGAEATRNAAMPFARHFAERTRRALATLPAADNPYLWQVLAGRFPPGSLAPWLNAPKPARMPEVAWTAGSIDDALSGAEAEFDFAHLSNVLDWLDPETARATLEKAHRALRPGGCVFIRQLNSTLDIPALGAQFDWLTSEAEALHAADRSFFYRRLHLGRRR